MPRTAPVAFVEAQELPSRRGRPVSMEKQQAVLEAAIAEFTAHGYDAASMDAIAERAGVSKRTLYNRHASKEGLFAALVGELAQRIVMTSSLEYRQDRSLRRQLLDYAEESRALMAQTDNLRLLRAVLAEHIRNPERVEPLLHQYWTNEYGFVSWMKAARADGKLRGSPATMGHLMSAMMKSVIFWPALLGRVDPAATRSLTEAIDMFLAYYQSQP